MEEIPDSNTPQGPKQANSDNQPMVRLGQILEGYSVSQESGMSKNTAESSMSVGLNASKGKSIYRKALKLGITVGMIVGCIIAIVF